MINWFLSMHLKPEIIAFFLLSHIQRTIAIFNHSTSKDKSKNLYITSKYIAYNWWQLMFRIKYHRIYMFSIILIIEIGITLRFEQIFPCARLIYYGIWLQLVIRSVSWSDNRLTTVIQKVQEFIHTVVPSSILLLE